MREKAPGPPLPQAWVLLARDLGPLGALRGPKAKGPESPGPRDLRGAPRGRQGPLGRGPKGRRAPS